MNRYLAPALAMALVAPWPAPGPAGAAQSAPAASAATDPVPERASPFLPDTVLHPPGGPRMVLLGTPGSGVAALRLHVPLVEGRAEAGVGLLLRELNLARMEGLARPVGARVSVTRTPWGVSYAVEGSVADFEYLAYLLREAVSRPPVGDVPLTRARQRLATAVARTAETPAGRLAAELRRALGPSTPAPEGTPGTLAALDAGRVLEAWQRSHQSRKMTLVVSAGVIPEVILAATRGLGTPDPADPGPVDAPPPPDGERAETQSLRSWYGRAWAAGPPDSPLGPVTALLVSEALADPSRGVETTLQLRELPERWAILVMGAAYRERAGAMRAAVDGALDAAEARLGETAVARAAARVRRDVLVRARTPLGLVEVVGRAMEPSGDPAGAARYLEALDRIAPEDVRAFLALLRTDDARAEVLP